MSPKTSERSLNEREIMLFRFLIAVTALVVAAGCATTEVSGPSPADDGRERIVFIGAHPDDSEGFAGIAFLLKDRYDLHIVDYTNGDFGLGEAGFRDGSTAKLRQAEERDACAFLGATPHFIGEIDSQALVTRRDVDAISALLRELNPVAVFCHWPVDGHPDHVMTAAALYRAMKDVKCRAQLYYYEVIPSETRAFRPLYSVDISAVMDKKTEMMRRYKCQNDGDWLAQDKLKQAAQRGAERVPAVRYAEAFTTYNGRPMKKGILHNLPETALVK